ncbi:hypothetical protein BDZ89DRAFT_1044880 [Hymenopellis radicata]|nr:hypothetical protein BDZ89DRAFT_1044880 [Hymenopellis radicata]
MRKQLPGQRKVTSFFAPIEQERNCRAVLVFFSEDGLQTIRLENIATRLRLLQVHDVLREADYMPPARIRLLRLEGACCEWRHWSHFRWIDVAGRVGKPIFFDAMPEGMALPEEWLKAVEPYLDAL